MATTVQAQYDAAVGARLTSGIGVTYKKALKKDGAFYTGSLDGVGVGLEGIIGVE